MQRPKLGRGADEEGLLRMQVGVKQAMVRRSRIATTAVVVTFSSQTSRPCSCSSRPSRLNSARTTQEEFLAKKEASSASATRVTPARAQQPAQQPAQAAAAQARDAQAARERQDTGAADAQRRDSAAGGPGATPRSHVGADGPFLPPLPQPCRRSWGI
jgi:hypothetical protein